MEPRGFLSPAVEHEFDAYLERIRRTARTPAAWASCRRAASNASGSIATCSTRRPACPRACWVTRDVTESVRAEQALKESERRFRLLADTTPVLIWMSDASGSCTFVNQPSLDFHRAAARRATRRRMGAARPPGRSPARRRGVLDGGHGATPFRGEYRVRRVDGAYHWMIGYAVPRIEEAAPSRGWSARESNVTEERRARDVLEMSRTRRIESLGVLAGGIAHEFNNLLTVIGGRIQLLLDRLSLDEPACRDLHLIQRSAQRAAALTQQLLAFGRRQILQPRLVDLNEFIQELSLAAAVDRRIEVTFRLEEPLRLFTSTRGSSSAQSSTWSSTRARRCPRAAGSVETSPTWIWMRHCPGARGRVRGAPRASDDPGQRCRSRRGHAEPPVRAVLHRGARLRAAASACRPSTASPRSTAATSRSRASGITAPRS